jgi:hypothetical protein
MAVGLQPAGNGAEWNIESIAEFVNDHGIVERGVVAAYAENGSQVFDDSSPDWRVIQRIYFCHLCSGDRHRINLHNLPSRCRGVA